MTASDSNDGESADRRERRQAVACLAAFLVVYLIYLSGGTFRSQDRVVGTLFDDALISLRYAQHLVGGDGLVWNVGEQPPIEGYSNLGWTLVMAAAAAVLPYDMAPIGVSLIGAAILLLCGVVARRLLEELGASNLVRLAGTFLVLGAYPTVFWTLRGLEVGALALLLLIAAHLSLARGSDVRPFRSLLLVSTISGLALLTRNDAALLFLPALAYTARRQRSRLAAGVALLPMAVCAAGQVLFRYAYYGELAPNTYVLKMTGVAAGTRLAAGFSSLVDTFPVIAPAVLIIAVAAFAAHAPSAIKDCCRLALATLALQWAYLSWIGGDAWLINYSNRFIATILPLLLVSASAAVPAFLDVLQRSNATARLLAVMCLLLLLVLGAHHPNTFGRGSQWLVLAGWLALIGAGAGHAVWPDTLPADRMAGATALALFLATSAHGWIGWSRDGAPKAADDIAFARLGLMLRDTLPADAVVAAGWVGAPAYFSRLQSIDVLGKTDAHVARAPAAGVFRPGHNKMDLAHSIGRLRPHVVALDQTAVAEYGYRRLSNGLWLRGDVPAGQDAVLGVSWCVLVSLAA